MKKLVFAMIGLISTSQLLAEDYYLEVEASYFDGEFLEQTDYDGYGGKITGYMNLSRDSSGVSLDEGPYAEAAFLSRASSLSIGKVELDLDTPSDDSQNAEFAEVRLVFGSGGIFEFGAASVEDLDIYTAAAGTYWGENLSTIVRLSKTTGEDADPFQVELDTHGHIPMGDNALSFDLTVGWVTQDVGEGETAKTDFSGILGGSATYFIGRNLGFGISADMSSLQDKDVYTYSANTEYFFTEKLGVMISYRLEEADGTTGKLDEVTAISLKGRL